MSDPVYAVPGEPYVPGMVTPIGETYGYVIVDNEETRHVLHGGSVSGFPVQHHYEFEFSRGRFAYVAKDVSSRPSDNIDKFLGYDGVVVDDPVNQWYEGRAWLEACGTFASHIAEFRDHYHMLREPGTYDVGNSIAHTDESNMRNKVALWWSRGLNGEAFRQLVNWMPPGSVIKDPDLSDVGLSPIIDPTAHADLNWKITQTSIANLMKTICENCLGFNILRRFHRRCRPIDWRTSLGSGILTVPDFALPLPEMWSPRAIIRNFSLLSRTRKSEIWDELMEWNGRALDWYDENVATDITSHS